MLLDSTFLIDILRKTDDKTLHRAEELDESAETKTVSAVSVLELWRGALRSIRREEEKQRVNNLLLTVHVFPFTEIIAKKAAEIEALLLAQGEIIDLEDIMIAATALVHREHILTRNDNHFKRIKNLSVETY